MTKPLLLLALLAPTLASAAIELPVKECAGRLEFAVPERIEYALAGKNSLISGSQPKWNVATFPDDTGALWTNMKYGAFEPLSSEPQTEIEAEELRKKYFEISKDNHEYFYADTPSKPKAQYGKLVKWFGEGKTKAFGESAPRGIEFIFYDKNFYYFYKTVPKTKEMSEENDRLPLVADYKQIAENFRRRELNEIPTEVGACMPYGFIRDDGQVPIHFQTTFRLKDHPEVEVSIFEESERGKKEAKITRDREHSALVWNVDGFFEDHYYWTKSLSRGFIFNRYHSLTMNGKNALWSRGNYTAPNGSKNITFVAAVLGDQNNPHIEVAVARYTGYAQGTPMSDEEVIDLGKRIAESVRVRPTSNAPTPPYPNFFEPVN